MSSSLCQGLQRTRLSAYQDCQLPFADVVFGLCQRMIILLVLHFTCRKLRRLVALLCTEGLKSVLSDLLLSDHSPVCQCDKEMPLQMGYLALGLSELLPQSLILFLKLPHSRCPLLETVGEDVLLVGKSESVFTGGILVHALAMNITISLILSHEGRCQ